MTSVLKSILHHRLLFIVLGLIIIGAGLWSYSQLQVEAYPDISDTQAVVITTYPGFAAEEVEQQVTIPIERVLNNVPNIIDRRSRTIFGLSVVELTFADGTDDYFARQQVLEKLRDATLPDGVTPSLGPLSSGISELFRYRLEGKDYSEIQLREIEDWVVVPALLQLDGVADITTFGGLVKQFQIEIDPMKMEKYHLSISTIAQAVGANSKNAGGAMLDNRQQSMVVRGVGLILSTSDIENVIVDSPKGVPIFVKDLGKVKIDAAPQTGIFGFDDKTGGVEGIVLLRRWKNPSEVLKLVKEKIEELNENLPKGVRIVTLYDRGDLVNNTLKTVSHTLAEGLIIVALVLLFFLGNLRAAILTAITIPLSLLFAFICMKFFGVPANLLSLGALDFGIIVDGTLVMVEYIVHKLDERRNVLVPNLALETIYDAVSDMARPIFFSLLIIISAYIPLFTLERVERRLFSPMAFTVCSALIGSLLLTLTLVPVLATFLFGKGAKTWHNPLLNLAYKSYEKILRFTVPKAWLVLPISVLVIILGLLVGRFLGTEFLPQLDEGVIWIRANLPAGISLKKSSEIASKIRSITLQFPEVKLVSSQTGRNDSGTDPFGPNRNEFLVDLHPYETWASGKTKAQLVEELGQKLRSQIPGTSFNFTQPIIDTSTEMATGSSADLAVIIKGSDLTELRRLAKESLAMLQKVKGAADAAIEQEEDQAQMRIRVKRQEIARYGINVSDVQDVIEMAIGGRTVGAVFEGERRFDITIRYKADARSNQTSISNILVPTKDGGRIPLFQLANIEIINGATIIARRDNQRQITVRTNIRGRDQGGFVKEAQQKFNEQIKLPNGYGVEWGGQFENLDRARHRLSFILPIVIALIFALLFSTFGSARYAGLVLMSVPFSLVGGIIALNLRCINLSVSAAVGFISLFGVAVMSGVLLVAEINRHRSSLGSRGRIEESIIQGSLVQMRPILMMILVAMLGMVPAARATGIGSDVQRPLATVVVGGLTSTLFLTLLALPSLYKLLARDEEIFDDVEED